MKWWFIFLVLLGCQKPIQFPLIQRPTVGVIELYPFARLSAIDVPGAYWKGVDFGSVKPQDTVVFLTANCPVSPIFHFSLQQKKESPQSSVVLLSAAQWQAVVWANGLQPLVFFLRCQATTTWPTQLKIDGYVFERTEDGFIGQAAIISPDFPDLTGKPITDQADELLPNATLERLGANQYSVMLGAEKLFLELENTHRDLLLDRVDGKTKQLVLNTSRGSKINLANKLGTQQQPFLVSTTSVPQKLLLLDKNLLPACLLQTEFSLACQTLSSANKKQPYSCTFSIGQANSYYLKVN